MSEKPPFMNAYGQITKVLDRAKEAKTPNKFSQDFLATVLKCPGGSPKPVIPLLKRLGFLSPDGTPTPRYKKFRNPDLAGGAMAEGVKEAFSELYKRNEYTHDLTKEKLKNLIVESTGLESDSSTVKGTLGTFLALKAYADFDAEEQAEGSGDEVQDESVVQLSGKIPPAVQAKSQATNTIGISYQINVILPDTDDPAVFNAIFGAMREHLMGV